MKICLICVEIFGWGKYGGFGRSTRIIGRELISRGIEVCAVVPRRGSQRAIEELDGMRVLSFPMYSPLSMVPLLKQCNADIYHSQHTSFGTYLALKVRPRSRHVITFRDPKELNDWWLEIRYPSSNRIRTLLNWIYEDGLFVSRAIRQVDACFTASEFLNEKISRKYGIPAPLDVLPTPIGVPSQPSMKSEKPTVCYVGRLDRRKRPELFFALARAFPDVRFIVAGRANDPQWEQRLVKKFGGLRNLEFTGFVDQFGSNELAQLFTESWVYVNTSVREGMPTAMLEAMAHGCAVLAHVDPNGVTTRFGKRVTDNDFAGGLQALLEGDAWRSLGTAGRNFVHRRFALEGAIDKHIGAYQKLLNEPLR